jgi:hypothetical protein
MVDYYGGTSARGRRAIDLLPEYGVMPESNPGEGPDLAYSGTPSNSKPIQSGAGQARRRPAGDLGSQVGVQRNLEYSAGSRSHRISTGSYTRA